MKMLPDLKKITSFELFWTQVNLMPDIYIYIQLFFMKILPDFRKNKIISHFQLFWMSMNLMPVLTSLELGHLGLGPSL